ncbi:MAG: hypothetical protein ACYTGP_08265 [Planctomycetota bacterium]|jgi:hypothetical protein
MNGDDRDAMLVEQVAAAWRPRDRDGGVRWHPVWADLDEAGRREVFEVTGRLRAMEAALDPRGLSGTGREVLRRIRG